MNDDAFGEWMKTKALCLFLNPSSIDEQVEIYMRQAWDEAIRQAKAEIPFCVDCGDGITAHDPGVCGNCYAMKYEKP